MISSSLTVTETALYWFHLSVGVPQHSVANLTIAGLNDVIGIVKYDTGYPQDQLTIDGMHWVPKGAKVSVVNKVTAFSSPLPQTAWLGIRLDTIMTPLEAFYVIKRTSQQFNPGFQMTYDKVIVNEGNGWDSATHKFTALTSGVYYVSYGIATIRGCCSYQALLNLMVNSNVKFLLSIYEGAMHNDVILARSSVLLHLNNGDTLYTMIPTLGNNYFYGDDSGQTYLLGFLSTPQSGSRQVAWSVASSSSVSGSSSKISFDALLVNENNTWDSANNWADIPVAGTYLVDLTAYLGKQSGTGNEWLRVLSNGNAIIELKLDAVQFDNSITRSRSTLVNLLVGDKLIIDSPANGSYYSSPSYLMAFSGLLVNPL